MKVFNSTKLVLVTGFIASNEHGNISTLGRGGSDFTATILAKYIHPKIILHDCQVKDYHVTYEYLDKIKETRTLCVFEIKEDIDLKDGVGYRTDKQHRHLRVG